jgi:hypothetical protein
MLIAVSVFQATDANRAQLASEGLSPARLFLVAGCAVRKHCDLNRSCAIACECSAAEEYHSQYHNSLRSHLDAAVALLHTRPGSRPLFIDLHGQSYLKSEVLRGTVNGKTCPQLVKAGGLWGPAPSFLSELHARGCSVKPTDGKDEVKEFNGGMGMPFLPLLSGRTHCVCRLDRPAVWQRPRRCHSAGGRQAISRPARGPSSLRDCAGCLLDRACGLLVIGHPAAQRTARETRKATSSEANVCTEEKAEQPCRRCLHRGLY